MNFPIVGPGEVLRTLIFKENNVSTKDNKWFTVRIMPYRTLEDRIDGLVITFIEITTAKRLETELKVQSEFLRNITYINLEKA